MIRAFFLFLLFVGPGFVGGVQAQQNRLLPVDDWAYDYITRLQRRGHLLDLNPTASPYRRGDVLDALARIDSTGLNRSEQHWVGLLERALKPVRTEEDEIALGYMFEAGARMINSDRLDVVRPLGDTLNVFWYDTPINFYGDAGPFIAEIGLRQDTYYDRDPDGLDTALRVLVRSENSYFGYHHGLFSAYLGRWSNHWSVPGEPGLLINNNARSQDQIYLRLGRQRLSITGLLTELDSITEDGRFTGRVADDSVRVDNKRRFLATHRWDWRPSPYLTISFMESVLYSGKNAGPSLKYLNPVHNFWLVVDNTPKNDENNILAAWLLWAKVRQFTLYGQLMIDDINSRGESGNETVTFALAGSLVYTASSFDLGGRLEVVTARAYNAPQPEGKYIYLLRGLATHFADYVYASAFADVYLDNLAPGLRLTPRLDLLAQGERDFRRAFPANDAILDNLLDGTVTRTVRPALQVVYQPSPWWWIRFDGGVNITTNLNHLEGLDETRFVGLLEVGLRLTVDRAFSLSFP